ncbi:hypothetical protein PsYK624_076480 [Phanerochaete sordida]|uniref:Uncharacterized protein n=1 Tax=Phanerochaete sordida TaxID=48140 RepID=A0A9P3LEG8_9APHY|nr:hypothetical protein PsYK624_076480 [Phanerochaete sordida]
MQPTFILTRAFAISALFVGAAPLAQAAPIYPTAAVPCVSGISCSGTSSSLWAFIAAIVPSSSSSSPVNFLENLYPQDASPVSQPPEAERETVAVVVVVEETCRGGACESSLYKRDEVEFEARDLTPVEERSDDVDIIIREPELEQRDGDVDIIIRDPVELEDREADPEPAPTCFNVAYCKREPEPERASD